MEKALKEAQKIYQEKNPVIRIDIETYNILMKYSEANKTTIKNTISLTIKENDMLKVEVDLLKKEVEQLRIENDLLKVDNSKMLSKEKKGLKEGLKGLFFK